MQTRACRMASVWRHSCGAQTQDEWHQRPTDPVCQRLLKAQLQTSSICLCESPPLKLLLTPDQNCLRRSCLMY